jgi:DNA-binding XRE family transcriptional regulator
MGTKEELLQQEWGMIAELHAYLRGEREAQPVGLPEDHPDAGPGHILIYKGRGEIEDVAADLLDVAGGPPDEMRGVELTRWTVGKELTADSYKISTDGRETWHTFGPNNQVTTEDGVYLMRVGVPTRLWLTQAALFMRTLKIGTLGRKNPESLRAGLVELLEDVTAHPVGMQVTRDGDKADVTPQITDRLNTAAETLKAKGTWRARIAIEDEIYPPPPLPGTSSDVPAKAGRPTTPEMSRDPFQSGKEKLYGGEGLAAAFPTGPFVLRTTRALIDAESGVGDTYKGGWGLDGTGQPVRVEALVTPYKGTAIFTIQGHNASPADIDAGLGAAMLKEIDMDTVWTHLLLLAHASDPNRRGRRSNMRIPRDRVERALGISRQRTKAYTARERFEKTRKVIQALQRVHVRFQEVTRHGEKLFFKGDATPSPLWNLSLQAYGQKNLFDGTAKADWYLEAKEGLWADKFLHENDSPQWGWLPVEFFDHIDRRRADYAQRLAAYLLFLLRANAKRGHRASLTAETMLKLCQVDLSRDRQSSERSGLKNKLLGALGTLDTVYGFDVDYADVAEKPLGWDVWMGRCAYFGPPDVISGQLFGSKSPAELPPKADGKWTGAQIRALRTAQGLSQQELGQMLDVSRNFVSMLENERRTASRELRRALDKIEKRG